MNLNDIIEKFELPGVAADQLRAQAANIREVTLDDGVSMMSGHDRGVAYRFFTHTVLNEKKSKIVKYKHYDEVDMIEWLVDRRSKPTEIALRHFTDPSDPSKTIFKSELPEELLSFDDEGVCIGGAYKEAYDRFKSGRNSPGIPLSKWGVLSDAMVATLGAAGIFSVEQLAAQPRSKIEGKFPEEIVEAFEQAIIWETSKDSRAVASKQSEEILKLSEEVKLRDREMAELKAQVKALNAAPAKGKPGRKPNPRKYLVEDDTIGNEMAPLDNSEE